MRKLFIAIAAVTVVLSAALASVPGITAQEGVAVLHRGVENEFPEGLRFYIDAHSASPIEEIRVYVRKLGQSSRSVYRVVEFEPGTSISGDVLFESQTSNEYIPPGTRLSYHFEIRTADGAVLETEPDVIVYLNRGLDWDLVSSGLINVYYYRYDDQSEERANQVLDVAADTYDFMRPILGVELTEPMNIVVYSDYADMRAAQPPKSRVAQQQLRTLGQAFTNERTLLVDGSTDVFFGDNIVTTTAHEFTHLLVADAAGSTYGQVPTWLNEGLAVYSEGRDDDEYSRYVSVAIRNDQVPPLSSLRTYSGTPVETLRNYGLGHAFVSYMLETYGAGKMVELFDVLRSMHNFEKSLQATYGLTINELDNQWRESVGLAPRDLSTPALPPLQVLPTRRPTSTPATEPAVGSAPPTEPASTPPPTDSPAPTYTPLPAPTTGRVAARTDPSPPDDDSPPPQPAPAGCGAAPEGATAGEVASLALLAAPIGLIGLTLAKRRRRGKG